MANERNGTKYGSAASTRVWVCPDGHVHLIGMSDTGEYEYEIVLGEKLMENVEISIAEARTGKSKEIAPNPPTH